MFGEVSFALGNQPSPADYPNMKPAFAQLAPTVPVAFAAAMGIALSVFLLPGAGVPSEPAPLLAVIGGAAGRVAADLPAPVVHHASTRARNAATPARLAATRPARLVPRRRQAGAGKHRTHQRPRTRAVPPARSVPAPVQAAAPAAPATPVTTLRSFSNPRSKKGKSRGHAYGHSRALQPAAVSPAPRAHGHGKAKALGHSSDHHSGVPPGQAKKAPTVPPPAPPTALPKANGNGNGKNGGKK
jgi:hypothetical protein